MYIALYVSGIFSWTRLFYKAMYIVPTYTYLPGLVYPVLICAALFLISPLFMNVASEADKSDAVSGYID